MPAKSYLYPSFNYLRFVIRSIFRHPLVYNLLIVITTVITYKIAKSGMIISFSRQAIDLIIFAFCVAQLFYFVVFSLRKLFYQTGLQLAYPQILFRIFGNIVFVLLTFTANYWCLFDNDPSSITGLNASSTFRELLDMFYFSCVTFATVGYGDILPKSMAAKSCVILEMATAFFLVVFVISNAGDIVQSARKNMKDE